VAGLLLWRLRELEPLLPFARYADVVATDVSSESQEAQVAALRSLVHELAPDQWRAVKNVINFLAQLASCAQLNDSSVAALAFVFAPILSRPPGSAFMSVRHLQDLAHIRKVVHTMVEQHQEVFAETQQGPSRGVRTTIETPSWELSAVDELLHHTVGMLFERETEVFDEGTMTGTNMMRWKEAHPAKSSATSKGEGSVAFFTWEPTVAAGARERRRMVQACRTLRAQIKRFEEDFISQHGRAPKGVDRAPLASTYVQYREWKRNIRDHAGVQIQAFYRGSALRSRLHHVQQKLTHDSNSENKSSAVNHRSPERHGNDHGPSQAACGPAAATTQPHHDVDLLSCDIAALHQEKKLVKQQLKAFDARFFADHGRMPSKAEKEPIRKLYELYHTLKAKLEAKP